MFLCEVSSKMFQGRTQMTTSALRHLSSLARLPKIPSILELKSLKKSSRSFSLLIASKTATQIQKSTLLGNGQLFFLPWRQLQMPREKPFVGPKSLEKMYARDGMHKSFALIYKTDFHNYFLSAQFFVVFSLVGLIMIGVATVMNISETPEEKKRQVEAKKSHHLQLEREKQAEKNKFLEKSGVTDWISHENVASTPNLGDFASEDLTVIGVMFSCLFSIALAFVGLLRTIPVRIYAGKKNHCIAMFHSSFIPGKISRHDFVAGLVKKHNVRFFDASRNNSIFKDGSGQIMVIMEQYFRQPADFDYLIGRRSEMGGSEDRDEDEMDAIKRSASFDDPDSYPSNSKRNNKK